MVKDQFKKIEDDVYNETHLNRGTQNLSTLE